jgi:hypothetical protein
MIGAEFMEDFIKVDSREFAVKGMENGDLVPVTAVKFARIIARQGTVGEEVQTYTQGGLLEKTAIVALDEKTQQPGWIATKVDENGEVIVDEFNHKNEWIIDDSTFKRKYEIDPENPGLFKPVGGPQKFVQLPVNVTVTQWGSEMNIEAGGWLNVTNLDDVYGISQRDFEDTYRIVEEQPKVTL